MAVYILHFSSPLKHARHYIGFCENGVERRLEEHKAGRGARLIRAVVRAGINVEVARIYPDGDRFLERRLKRQKNSRRYCPICRQMERVAYGKDESQW